MFPSSFINAHVNECLNKDQSAEADDKSKSVSAASAGQPVASGGGSADLTMVDNPASPVSMKRKSSSTTWGSLKPMRSSHQGGPTSTSPTTAKKQKRLGEEPEGVKSAQEKRTQELADDEDVIVCGENGRYRSYR
jgi:hypothetical protein